MTLFSISHSARGTYDAIQNEDEKDPSVKIMTSIKTMSGDCTEYSFQCAEICGIATIATRETHRNSSENQTKIKTTDNNT